jgi:hypothetical protein
MEASCVAGTVELFHWGIADWANEGHGYASRLCILMPIRPRKNRAAIQRP